MSDDSVARRLRLALDMYETGMQMQRSRLRRENPGYTEAEINAAIQDWLVNRPLDAPGRLSHRFDHLTSEPQADAK